MDPADSNGGQHHSAARLRSRRGPQHSRRQICRAAVFGRRAAEAARRDVPGRPTSSGSTIPACSAGPPSTAGTSKTSSPKTHSLRSRIRSSTSSRIRESAPSSSSTTTAASSSASRMSPRAACSEYPRSTRPTTGRCNTSRARASRSRTCWSSRRAPADVAGDQTAGGVGRVPGAHEGRVHHQDLRFLHVPDGHRHEHADHDGRSASSSACRSPGQTFYTFMLENLEKFGALKAIGAKGRELILHDPIPGRLRRADRLRDRRRAVRGHDLAGPAESAGLRGDHQLLATCCSPFAW